MLLPEANIRVAEGQGREEERRQSTGQKCQRQVCAFREHLLLILKFFVTSTKITVEAQHGLISQVIKDVIFSMRPKSATTAVADVTDTAMNIG